MDHVAGGDGASDCLVPMTVQRLAGMTMQFRIGVWLTLMVLGLDGRLASASGFLQGADDEPVLERVDLPDVSRMHTAVQGQLSEAYTWLRALETAGAEGIESPSGLTRRAERSAAYGELGMLLLAGEYLEAAERCFQNARLLTPGEFRWPYYLAHVLMKQGDLPRAVAQFEYARRLQPDDLAVLVWLGHVYIDLGRPEAAEPVLTEALSRHPGSQAVLFQMGRAALAVENHTGAVEHLEAALSVNPAAAVIHYPLAMAYRGLGDLDRARNHLDRSGGRAGAGYAGGAAVRLPDPLMAAVDTVLRSPQVHRDLGLQASERGDWPEAARQFGQAVDLAPANAAMRLNLGIVLNLMGSARGAYDQLEAALGLDPDLAAASYTLGTILERNGQDAAAIERYRAAVTNDPNLSGAHLRLANALRRTGQLDASLSFYGRVLDDEEARFGEAMALARLGRYGEARERLTIGLDHYPEQPGFPLALARVLAAAPVDEVRDGQRALDLVLALAEDYKTAAVAETMAMALAELQLFSQAVEWQRFAMGLAADAALPDVAQRMSINLTRYLQELPARTPWRDEEPEYNPGPPVDPGLLDPSRP